MWMDQSQVIFNSKLPSPRAFPDEAILLYDSVLLKNKHLRTWIRKFPFQLALKSGETLKTLNSFEAVLQKLNRLSVPQTTDLAFIAMGGGSVGDFVGFLASVFWRGRPLIHIPSTWLAAVDSAHGGKNGLNLAGEKNQLGTFYPAQKIYISAELLQTQPPERLQEALGEFVKIAIISDKNQFAFLEKNVSGLTPKKILSILPRAIHHKYRIVDSDPYEKKGLRRVLNLGHTMGHVFESYYGWPHGLCILLGVLFSVRWSYHLKLTDEGTYIRISNLIEEIWPEQMLSADLAGIPLQIIAKKLKSDKKRTSQTELDFIFIERIGSVLRRRVKITHILAEIQRQKEEY